MEFLKSFFFNICIFFLQILDGENNAQLLKRCGNEIPEPVTSTSNSIIVKFKTDSSVQASGFLLNWTAVNPDLVPVTDPDSKSSTQYCLAT